MGFTALIAAGIGAAGAVGGSLIQSNAAKSASQTQAALSEQALTQQQQMFNEGLQQQQALYGQGMGIAQGALQPYVQAGQSVLPTLQGLITPGPNQNALLSQTPGFQFAQQYGTMAAQNALAGRGLGLSAGPMATAISQYNQGLAGNTWQSVVSALQGYAGLGGNAAGALGSSALGGAVNAGNQILTSATGAGNAQAGTLTNIGSSLASGTLGSANALSSGVLGTSNALSNAALFSGIGGTGGLYNVGNMPAAGAGAPNDLVSNAYAISQGINPYA